MINAIKHSISVTSLNGSPPEEGVQKLHTVQTAAQTWVSRSIDLPLSVHSSCFSSGRLLDDQPVLVHNDDVVYEEDDDDLPDGIQPAEVQVDISNAWNNSFSLDTFLLAFGCGH